MGVYLIKVHLTGVHIMGVYLIKVHLTGVGLMGVHLTAAVNVRMRDRFRAAGGRQHWRSGYVVAAGWCRVTAEG
jgi:hypothetical protein